MRAFFLTRIPSSFRTTRSGDPESRDSGFDAAHRPGMTALICRATIGPHQISESRHEPSRHILVRRARRCRAGGGAATGQGVGDAGSRRHPDVVRDGETVAAVAPGLRLCRRLSEAATIGGLADWYAVVALFKRPLGLPIPH